MFKYPRLLIVVGVGLTAVVVTIAGGYRRVSWDANEALRRDGAEIRSLLERGAYGEAEVRARALHDAMVASLGGESLPVYDAGDLLVQAFISNGRGASEETRRVAEAVLLSRQAYSGPDQPATAPSLLNLGDVLIEAADLDNGVALLRRGVGALERAEPTDEQALGLALDRLGDALTRSQQHDEAAMVLRRSLLIKEASADDRSIARTLEAIGRALQRKGDYEAAREPVARAVAIRKRGSANHPEYIGTLFLVEYQQWFDGRHREALETAAEAVRLAERTLHRNHPLLAQALRLQAGANVDLWELERARELLERAVAIAETSLGDRHPETAWCLNDLANPILLMGDYQTARALYERALHILESRFGSAHDLVATAVYNVALVDSRLGDLEKAGHGYRRAAETWRTVFHDRHPFVAQALAAEAGVLQRLGRSAEAIPKLEDALSIRAEAFGENHAAVARSLVALAVALKDTHRTQPARDRLDRALRIRDRLRLPEDPELAATLTLFADLERDRGRLNSARRSYERAVAISERVLGSMHPDSADMQMNLATTLEIAGEYRAAFETARQAESAGRDHLRLMLRTLPERQSLLYAASRPRGLDLVLSLVDIVPQAVPVGADSAIRSRSLVLDESAARVRARLLLGAESDGLYAELSTARERLANLLVRGQDVLAPARYTAMVQEARQRSEMAERRLAEKSAAFRDDLSRAHIGLTEVTAALPARTAMVSIIRYDRTPFTASRRRGSPAESSTSPQPAYVAFVLRHDAAPAAIPLASADLIDALVSRWRDAIAAITVTNAGRSSPSASVAGAALSRTIWDPVAPYLENADHVFIVPDGSLTLVPFAALTNREGRYLLEVGPIIHYLSAERDIVPEALEARRDRAGLLALGGPSFDGREPNASGEPDDDHGDEGATALRSRTAPCVSFESARFAPLDDTLLEVRDVSTAWAAHHGSGTSPARLLLAQEATESAFKRAAPAYSVLHLATHGFFLGQECSPSAKGGTRGVGGITKIGSGTPIDNPLLLSGLALAGANRRAAAAPDEDDGILTAEEVASLNLSGVEWAVLSACDTGVGEIKAGEGVFGLRRAFQVAGARTVIMSLWSVEDQATRAWMRALYEERFQKGATTADAVHAASLAVLRDRRAKGQSTHPFFWAAFVAAGDWR